jgi:DNA-binding XRE family transcriptional regulator
MAVQYLDTPAGRFAVLPEDDFRALVDAAEDAADMATIDEFRRRLEAGEDEVIPFEMVERRIAGEHPVRLWREHRGLSGRDLAEASGLNTACLSQIETGARDGSMETMKKIAAALRVTLDDLA